ncbi:hypothetical protein FOL47_005646 [Perkinsus chesapeaki]|uniref:Uncharacterized protein n=1 Tax=Perkinsus chesapeaki TaxID=330153 RepID=A0A7J6LWQ5_PERCH|nr:hypothetical protein FOL47_005646 [Perkinsus chesapeaki]
MTLFAIFMVMGSILAPAYAFNEYKSARQLAPPQPYDGTYVYTVSKPYINIRVVISSPGETMHITFTCGQTVRPYDHIFNFRVTGQGEWETKLSLALDSDDYKDMLKQFVRVFPAYASRPLHPGDLGKFTADIGSLTLDTEIGDKQIIMDKQEGLSLLQCTYHACIC